MFEFPWILLLTPFSLAWWAFGLVLFLCAVLSTRDDDTIAFALLVTVLGGALYTMFGPGLVMLAWMAANLKIVAMIAGAYAAVGVGWCYFKWFRFAIVARDLLVKLAKAHGMGDMSLDERLPVYVERRWPFRTTRDDDGKTLFRPAAKVYKAKIAHWVLLWPLSVLWTGLEEWIIALKDLIFECIGGLLNKISAWAWRGVDFK
jgi:hypothetical protein